MPKQRARYKHHDTAMHPAERAWAAARTRNFSVCRTSTASLHAASLNLMPGLNLAATSSPAAPASSAQLPSSGPAGAAAAAIASPAASSVAIGAAPVSGTAAPDVASIAGTLHAPTISNLSPKSQGQHMATCMDDRSKKMRQAQCSRHRVRMRPAARAARTWHSMALEEIAGR